MSQSSQRRAALKALTVPVALALGAPLARAQASREVKVGLLVPLSGLYARPGAVMRMGERCAERERDRHRQCLERGAALG